MFRNARAAAEPSPGWWNERWFLGLMVLASVVPLLWPTTPPLTDLMGHMGRYRIELSDPQSQLRTQYYGFQWGFIANLGVDLLIVPMAKLFGLELGIKLIVLTIPPLTTVMDLYLPLARQVNPATRFAGISLNTGGMTDREAADALLAAKAQTGLPAADPLRGGSAMERLVDACLAHCKTPPA